MTAIVLINYREGDNGCCWTIVQFYISLLSLSETISCSCIIQYLTIRHLILKFDVREVFDIIDINDITEILLEVALNIITLTLLDIDRPGNISIVLYTYVDRSLSFWSVCCLLSVVCSSIYEFWLAYWYLHPLLLTVMSFCVLNISNCDFFSNSYVLLCLKHQ